jgi:hypothetical protein
MALSESTFTYLCGWGAEVGEGDGVDEVVGVAVIRPVGLVADVQATTTNANTIAATLTRDDAIRETPSRPPPTLRLPRLSETHVGPLPYDRV